MMRRAPARVNGGTAARRLESCVRWASGVGWAAAWALLVLAAGGAASARAAVLLGLPPLSAPLMASLALGGLALFCGRDAGGALLGLAPLLVALLLAAPAAGLRALTGPPLFALVAAGAVLALAASARRPPTKLFVAVVAVLFAGVSWRVQRQVGPQGDEPHYLMVADSLIRDGDLSLERDYALGRYRAFHPEPLQPHYRVRGRDGAIYSLHAVGLSLLILPAYALGGYAAVSFFMAALAVLLAFEIRALAADWTGRADLGDAAGWLAALSPPLIHYVGLVFTEVPAALLVAWTLRRAPSLRQKSAAGLVAWGAALALLPWLNVRYAVIAALVFFHGVPGLDAAGGGKRTTAVRAAALAVLPLAASALALAAYHWTLYGFFDPRLVYGRRPEFSLATLRDGLPGLLLDQEFGLLVYAPFLVLAVPGLAALARVRPAAALAGSALVASVLVVAGSWHMWRGGFNPPGRFLVPVLPVLVAAAAMALRRGVGAAAALAIGWGVWTGLSGAWEPRLVHRDRDATAPLFRADSGAEEWTRLLPGYVLAEPDRDRLAVVWAAALGAVALLGARPSRRATGTLAVGCAGLAAAAAVASVRSDARTGGRDAVRVLGRPALRIPGWTLARLAPARWGPEALDWGPLYEPHRFPDGAELGGRLPLPPGRYRLQVDADALGGAVGAGGDLEVRADGAVQGRRTPLRGRPGGFETEFEAQAGERALTLRLWGGPPFLVKELRLEMQPSAPPPVQSVEGSG
jgi:hypothetical protein